ncbi:MAG TPA: FlgD immunoglobulin-like domain containing protein, partial [Candidatus Eisenbacteria bacterium]
VDPSEDEVGLDTSIAIDGNGNVHISYHDASIGNLLWARRTVSGWSVMTVDDGFDATGLYSSIAVDSQGHPHIAYQNGTTANLDYAYIPLSVGVGDGPRSTPIARLRAVPNPIPGDRVRLYVDGPSAVGVEGVVIVDVTGRRIRELPLPDTTSGSATVDWDVRDEQGVRVSPGVYYFRTAGSSAVVRSGGRLVVTR